MIMFVSCVCVIYYYLLLPCFRISVGRLQSLPTEITMTAEVQHPPVKVETGTVIENPQQTNRQAESPPTIVTVRMVVDGKV